MAKWLLLHGFAGRFHPLDATVGGSFRMSFTEFVAGCSHTFGGEDLEPVLGASMRHTDRFDDPASPARRAEAEIPD